MSEERTPYVTSNLKVFVPPPGYEGVDEIAAGLGVAPRPGRGWGDVVISGRSGQTYGAADLVLAFIALAREVQSRES